jgi:nucleotide-binding universal stress UspA family protein
MVRRPAVLCAVDLSEASRGALRYAATLAEHFYANLTVLTVNDPLLVSAADATLGEGWYESETHQELEAFVHDAFPGRTPQIPELQIKLITGKPAVEILRAATDLHADVLVMSTHGLSGVRRMIFGSTTERVLRETSIPVIVTPASDPGPEDLEDWRRSIKTVVVPLDLSEFTPRQVQVASGLSDALATSLVLVHILEPLHLRPGTSRLATHVEAARRSDAYHQLEEVLATIPARLKPITVLGVGDPAVEIASIARKHGAGAIVMGLHSAASPGRGVGAVTYRLLCEAPVLVIAWPPSHSESRLLHREAAQTTGLARPYFSMR